MNSKLVILALLVVFLALAGCTSQKDVYDNPATLETKVITIAETYPRQDTYSWHFDPYVVTTDSEIYVIPSDKVWAKLQRGSTHRVRFNRLSTQYEGRDRDGIIREVLL